MNIKKTIIASASTLAAASANAVEIDDSFITSFGCVIYDYLTGPLSVWGFVIVVVASLLIGFFSKIDFAKIAVAVALFGVIQSVAEVAVEHPVAAAALGTASCLTGN